MKLVIQCAGSKVAEAGYFQTSDQRRVKFVAQPQIAPDTREFLFA